MSGLVNLTNHPLTSWPHEQREAAESVWGSVLELTPGATLVPLEATEASLVAQARALVDEVMTHGAVAALVAGELRLTLALVTLLQARGVACVTTVSERVVEEEALQDGTVRAVRNYRFAGFRAFPKVSALH